MLKHLSAFLLAVAAFGLAHAQSAPAPAASAASAPAAFTVADLTKDTACGAPGVGIHGKTGVIERRAGKAGQRVDRDGEWVVGCKMPPKPKDCPAQDLPASWVGEHGRTCLAVPGAVLPGRNISRADVTRYSAGYHDANPTPGQRRGGQVYECRASGWVLLRQWCQ